MKKKKTTKDIFSRYKTHSGERGNSEKWRKQAEALAAKLNGGSEDLTLLGLSELPATLEELKRARRWAIKKAHPDLGYEAEDAVKINEAYTNLKKRIEE